MKVSITHLIAACLLLSAAVSTTTVAAPAGASFNAPAENGKIERVDFANGELVVDDTRLRLSERVAVYTHRGFPTTADALHKGMRIAFDLSRDEAGQPYVSVIWILSKR